ncbi:MAG TPA: lysophospholipid acyltransferase family protein [Thermomicrobiales bacterium]|nr:lysophospholipid acyltransferase family protein [Thermomicrobiales bacterium]
MIETERPKTETPTSDIERYTLRGRPRRIVRGILYALFWVLIGFRIKHVDRAPATGPVIVVSNHLHNADPILTEIAFPRAVHYMAKKEVFRVPVVRLIVRWVGAFPVDRGKADRSAIRRASAALQHGIPVGLFPEGTRSPTRALQQAHGGAGLLALTSGAPVLPLIITGTEKLPFNGKRGRIQAQLPMPNSGHRGVRILFGEPFLIPRQIDGRKVTSDEATEIMMIEIARMLPPDYRGVYADLVARETVRRAIPWTGPQAASQQAPSSF